GLTATLRQLATAHDLWQSQLLLLQPARLVRRKNIELGIRLVAALAARGLDARLIVTGAPDPHQADGSRYFDELTQLASAAQVSRQVVFAGAETPLTDADLPGLYALADALFFPSFSEGFGLPLLEALQHRLPVWCSDLPVHREVLGATAAHRFAPDVRPEVLADQVAAWAGQEPSLTARRRVWRQHDWRVLCKEHLEPRLLAGIKKR
ncbi:MAG: glycosyltransferase, partial [Serpentinimonas sp.]|nr:glycosyltransferase [Chloroflexaceae bacterium]MCU0932579.1 glycosyltransferase [Serpentinimonas sp.]